MVSARVCLVGSTTKMSMTTSRKNARFYFMTQQVLIRLDSLMIIKGTWVKNAGEKLEMIYPRQRLSVTSINLDILKIL